MWLLISPTSRITNWNIRCGWLRGAAFPVHISRSLIIMADSKQAEIAPVSASEERDQVKTIIQSTFLEVGQTWCFKCILVPSQSLNFAFLKGTSSHLSGGKSGATTRTTTKRRHPPRSPLQRQPKPRIHWHFSFVDS
jgi:hypothetical protein